MIILFEHEKTGAELFYIANDDTNRLFDLTFFTDTIDNTGLPHVFEHATMSGSQKYPSSALIMNLMYQTYNTYMNAATSKIVTTYPVASLSEAQLLKYADFYTDCCFHPLLMEDEQIFRKEAWRYRMDDADAPLTIEGTVYTEMCGAWTLSRNALLNALRTAFPGSIAGNESGGDPDYIPDLTWESLKNYHDQYYHPSNYAAYLYGQFEDYAAFLKLLDGYFSEYDRKEFTHADEGYTPITEPVVKTFAFPVEQGSTTQHASVINYMFVCPGLKEDAEQNQIMSTMTMLFSDGTSWLMQRLNEALPYGAFSAFVQTQGPDFAVTFSAANVDPEDAEVFQAVVDAAIAEVAENGFPQNQIDSTMKSLKITALLTRDNFQINDAIFSIIVRYATTGNPWEYFYYEDALFMLDTWNQQGLYAKAAASWLAGNRNTALAITYPEPGAKEIKDAQLVQKLAEIKAAMSEEEIAAIVAASNNAGREGGRQRVCRAASGGDRRVPAGREEGL